jgi:hypothetical protein
MRRRVNWDNKDLDYVTTRISKKEMDNEFTLSKKNGVWTERAGELILTLVENVAFSPYFHLDNKRFITREAMIDYVILYILENGLRLYDPNNGNAFSYFSKVTFNRCYEFLRSTQGETKKNDIYGTNIKTMNESGKLVAAEFVEYNCEEQIDDYE